MRLEISSELLATILAEAGVGEDEICGLLLGETGAVAAAIPCANVAADPRRRFEVDPAALFAAHRRARAEGRVVLGHYHSHPNGSATPSHCDAAEAAPDGAVWLIVAAGRCRAWQAVVDGAVHGRFDPVDLRVTPPCAATVAPPEGLG